MSLTTIVIFNAVLLLLSLSYTTASYEAPLIQIISRDNFTSSSAFIPSALIPDLYEFTACLWFKLQSQDIQDTYGVGNYPHLFDYQSGDNPGTDNVYLRVHRPLMKLDFGVTNGGTLSIAEDSLDLFDDEWRHVCAAWSGLAGGLKKLYLSDIDGVGVYKEGDEFGGNNLKTSPIIGDTAGGSWLLMHEQDAQTDGTGVGDLDPSQSMIGQVAGFQLFSGFLDAEVINVTGCGLRADIFDSFYDPLVFIGIQLQLTVTRTAFCRPETVFAGYSFQQNRPYLSQASASSLHKCALTCLRDVHCLSFIYGAVRSGNSSSGTGETGPAHGTGETGAGDIPAAEQDFMCTLSESVMTTAMLPATHVDTTHIFPEASSVIGMVGKIKSSVLALII